MAPLLEDVRKRRPAERVLIGIVEREGTVGANGRLRLASPRPALSQARERLVLSAQASARTAAEEELVRRARLAVDRELLVQPRLRLRLLDAAVVEPLHGVE